MVERGQPLGQEEVHKLPVDLRVPEAVQGSRPDFVRARGGRAAREGWRPAGEWPFNSLCAYGLIWLGFGGDGSSPGWTMTLRSPRKRNGSFPPSCP